MSVLIKGMKMPEDCPQCPLSHWNKLDQLTGCELVRRYVPESESSYWQSDTRPEWCPLVGLPYHGDLIEKRQIVDALANAEKNVSAIQRAAETEKDIRYCQGVMVGYANSILAIDNAHVVIPAERNEDG